MGDILTDLAPLIDQINSTMSELISRDAEVVSRISGYSFESGGKRLRPLMFCLITKALGEPLTQEKMEFSASFEFLHMATLLHDDIVDLSELRRGRTAAHLVFSVPEAVLVGDYLLSKAAAIGAQTDNLSCVRAMADVVATLSLGELIQLSSRRLSGLSEEEYFKIIFRKTAVMMEGATKTASLLTSANAELRQAATRYGRKVGLAFQIMDDILDYQSDRATFGKPVGHDLSEGKITLPFIHARENLNPAGRARLCALAEQETLSQNDFDEIINLVAEGRGVISAKSKADELAQKAINELSVFPPSPARAQLESLARYIVSRNH